MRLDGDVMMIKKWLHANGRILDIKAQEGTPLSTLKSNNNKAIA